MAKRVAIVSGGNKGIGLAICRGLAKKFDGDVLLGSRSLERGQAAVEALSKEGCQNVQVCQLDIDDSTSVERLRDMVKAKYGGIDILVNNAGIAFKKDATEAIGVQAEVTCHTNYWSTKKACEILFPILKSGARVVNMSSWCGMLARLSDSPLKTKLTTSGSTLTVSELDEIMLDYVKSAKEGTLEGTGYSQSTYVMSKIGVSTLSRIQQQQLDKERSGDDLVVNHVHPGYVNTDMSSGRGTKSPDEGAVSALHAALLPPATKIRGKFLWDDGSEKDWETSTIPIM